MDVLLVDPGHSLPEGVGEWLSQGGWQVRVSPNYTDAASTAGFATPDAMVLPEPPPPTDPSDGETQAFRQLIRFVEGQEVATLLVAPKPSASRFDDVPFIDIAATGATKEEIRGRLSTIMRYHAMVRGMERDLRNMRRLSERLNAHFTLVDQEMRLAGRLQRDFLPKIERPFGPVKFATLFRPASEVSGDIYDVYRVDEEHIAFYVADAVGHGVAAGLLTMFIKRAIVSKRINSGHYDLLDPSDTMRGLNEALAAQMLPNCQFVTACYCLLNTRTLELACCRGGHPYPLLVEPDGTSVELRSSGGLLGLFAQETFDTERIQMRPGQKLILYTDGLETAFSPGDVQIDELDYYRQALAELCPLPAEQIVSRLDAQLNAEHGSINPRDDVTLLAMEILPVEPCERS